MFKLLEAPAPAMCSILIWTPYVIPAVIEYSNVPERVCKGESLTSKSFVSRIVVAPKLFNNCKVTLTLAVEVAGLVNVIWELSE